VSVARSLEKRQKVLLGVLAVLVLILAWRWLGSPGSLLGGAREAGAGAGGLGSEYQLIVALPELRVHTSLGVAYAPQRNLFDFTKCQAQIKAEEDAQRRRRQAQELRKQQLAEKKEREAAAAQNRAAREPTAVKPRAPEPRFTYLGYLGELEDKIAIFEKRGSEGEIMLAKVGDVVETEFVVRQIDWDRVELGFTRPEFAEGQKTLPMKGAES
jgi:hypothetical protein